MQEVHNNPYVRPRGIEINHGPTTQGVEDKLTQPKRHLTHKHSSICCECNSYARLKSGDGDKT